MDFIEKYFPEFSEEQKQKFNKLEELFKAWNASINVISRKDIEFFREKHLQHSLSIAKIINFVPGTKILDLGTGGGLPGLPLAIASPEVKFHLVDSIGKKIKVASAIAEELQLTNVKCEQIRAEEIKKQYDFIISRAVTALPDFMKYTEGRILEKSKNALPNGILYLKGGSYQHELDAIPNLYRIFRISDFYHEEYFETKDIILIRPLR